MTDRDVQKLRRALDSPLPAQRQAALARLSDAVPHLISEMRGEEDADHPMQRHGAAMLLLRLREEVLPHVLPLLFDPDAETRRWVLWILDQLRSPLACDALGKAVLEGEPEIRATCIAILAKTPSPDVIPPLQRALNSAQAAVRLGAISALGRRDPALHAADSAPLIAACLRDRDLQVACEAARVLAKLGEPGLAALFTESNAEQAPELRMALIEAMAATGRSEAVQRVQASLSHANPSVRDAAIRALGRLAAADGAYPLLVLLDQVDRAAQYEIGLALLAITRNQPTPILRGAIPALKRLAKQAIPNSLERITFSDCARMIDTATEQWADLPLPALSPPLSAFDLPIPATAANPDSDSLPIPWGQSGSSDKTNGHSRN